MVGFYRDFEKFGDSIAAVEMDGTRISYAEIFEYCRNLEVFEKEKSLVFLMADNSIGALCAYLSCLFHGQVPLLLKSDLEEKLLEGLLEIYTPEFIYTKNVDNEICSKYGKIEEVHGMKLLQRKSRRDHAAQNENIYQELALLLTTSGSTGSPKQVRLSYRNLQSNAMSIAEYLHLDAEERPITTLPMNYTYGLSIINSHILCGATILFTNRTFFETEFWDFFKRECASSFGGVPYHYEMLKRIGFLNMELPALRTITQAGGRLDVNLQKEISTYAKEKNIRFYIMYGQTEATARMSYLPPEMSEKKPGSIGIAIPGGRFELKDEELIYYGENVSLGYAQCRADLSRADERQGVLATGDLAKEDDDGYFYIMGRKKRFLKIYGNRVNLDEIHELLKEKFRGMQLACAGTDDKMYIFVEKQYSGGVYKDRSMAELQTEMEQYLFKKTGLARKVFHICWIDEIPKNEAGKIQYQRLEDLYQNE